jgi:hypothetical protein
MDFTLVKKCQVITGGHKINYTVVVSILKTKSGRGRYSFVTSQNTDYVSAWKTEESGIDFWRGAGIFLPVTA